MIVILQRQLNGFDIEDVNVIIPEGYIGVKVKRLPEDPYKDPKILEDIIKYEITLRNVKEDGAYTIVFADGSIIDFSENRSLGTSISFDESYYVSENSTLTKYYPLDQPTLESNAYGEDYTEVNEAWIMNEATGKNDSTKQYYPSTLYDLYKSYDRIDNNVIYSESELASGNLQKFAKNQFYYDPETETQVALTLAGWAETDANTGQLRNKDGKLIEIESIVDYNNINVYTTRDLVPATVNALRPVWEKSNVIFVSNSRGNDGNNGLSPQTPVKTILGAYSKLSYEEQDSTKQIIVVMDEVFLEGELPPKNVTITSFYAGIDYRIENNAKIKVTDNVSLTADLIFEIVRIDSISKQVLGSEGKITDIIFKNLLIANYNNLIIGQEVEASDGYYCFGAIIGGNYRALSTEIQNKDGFEHTIIVESGRYNNIFVGSALETSENIPNISTKFYIGSQKDANKADIEKNNPIEITGYLTLGENEVFSKDFVTLPPNEENPETQEVNFAEVKIYGGNFTGQNTYRKIEKAAVYLRRPDENVQATIDFKILGGIINGNIYTGEDATNKNPEKILTDCSIYGGTITGNIFGLGTKSFTGTSKLYIGGYTYIIGNIYGGIHNFEGKTILEHYGNIDINYASLGSRYYKCSKGEIFASHFGNVKIIDETKIDEQTGETKIISGKYDIAMSNGCFEGDVYGGSENNSQTQTNSNVVVSGTDIIGTVYGGSKEAGEVINVNMSFIGGGVDYSYASGKDVKITNSEILVDGVRRGIIHGGSNSEKTTVENSNIVIKSGTNFSIYGGGFNSKIENGSNITLEDSLREEVDFNDEKYEDHRYLHGNIFGGARLDLTNIPENKQKEVRNNAIIENANITINGCGMERDGYVNTIINIYGGGNRIKVNNANIVANRTLNDWADSITIYGGAYSSGIEEPANMDLESCIVDSADILVDGSDVIISTIYGGGYLTPVNDSDIIVNKGRVSDWIYGGFHGDNKCKEIMKDSNIVIKGGACGSLWDDGSGLYGGGVFGGGYQSFLQNSNITILDGEIGNVFGGSYSETMPEDATINLNILGGRFGSINGGGNISNEKQALKNIKTNVKIGKEAVIHADNIDVVLEAAGVEIPEELPTADFETDYIYATTRIYGESDYSLISTKGTETIPEVVIDGKGYVKEYLNKATGETYIAPNFKINKTIQGAGRGTNYDKKNGTTVNLYLKNYGIPEYIMLTESIERFTNVYIENSHVQFEGVLSDTTNELLKETDYIGYSFNRIDNLTIADGTNMYLEKNINRIESFSSVNTLEEKVPQEITYRTEIEENEFGEKSEHLYVESVPEKPNRIFTLDTINLYFAKEPMPWNLAGQSGSNRKGLEWGKVNGMTYYGKFAYNRAIAGKVLLDVFEPDTEIALAQGQAGFFKNRALIVGVKTDDYKVNGFYSNVAIYYDNDNDEIADGVADVNTKVVIPEDYDKVDSTVYASMWQQEKTNFIQAGEDKSNDYILLYAKSHQPDPETMETYQIDIKGLFGVEDITGTIIDIDTSLNSFKSGMELVAPDTMPFMAKTGAETRFSLEVVAIDGMTSGGDENPTYVLASGKDQTASIGGQTRYIVDASGMNPIFNFKLNSAANIYEKDNIGSVQINFTLTLGDQIKHKQIVIELQKKIDSEPKTTYTSSFKDYEDRSLNFSQDSEVELSFMYYDYEAKYLDSDETDRRILKLNKQFPVGTQITLIQYYSDYVDGKDHPSYRPATDKFVESMIPEHLSDAEKEKLREELKEKYSNKDFAKNSNILRAKKWYYQITEQNKADTEINLNWFTEEGNTDINTETFNWPAKHDVYLDEESERVSWWSGYPSNNLGIRAEKFDVLIDFENTKITEPFEGQVEFERRTRTDMTRFGTSTDIRFKIMPDSKAEITFGTPEEDGIKLLDGAIDLINKSSMEFNLKAAIEEQMIEGKTIIDTRSRNQSVGIAVELQDAVGNRIKLMDDNKFSYQSEVAGGLIRATLANYGIVSFNHPYKLDFAKKKILSGEYDLLIYVFLSDDGKFYDTEKVILNPVKGQKYTADSTFIQKIPVTITGQVGFTGEISNDNRIFTTNNDQDQTLNVKLKTNTKVPDGYTTVSISKRNPTYVDDVYQPVEYTDLDLLDYTDNTLKKVKVEKKDFEDVFAENEYYIDKSFSEENTIDFGLNLKENISTGEYKITFNVYSQENVLLHTSEKTIVVKE